MKYYTIYLSGGQKIEVSATDLKITYGIAGQITNLSWYNSNMIIRHLNPQHVSAIVEG